MESSKARSTKAKSIEQSVNQSEVKLSTIDTI